MSASPPYWQIDIQKRMGNEYWTNVYHVARSDQAGARAAGEFIISNLEIPLHREMVEFVSMRVAPFPGPSEGTIYPIGEIGGQPNISYLPMFVVMRVDFPAPTGRPSRKFYRQPVAEADQENGAFTTAAFTAYQGVIQGFFDDPQSSGLIDVDGQLLASGQLQVSLGMRQLRRGSKRRVTPVIPT